MAFKTLYLKGRTLRQEYPLCCIELVAKGLLPLLRGKCDLKSQSVMRRHTVPSTHKFTLGEASVLRVECKPSACRIQVQLASARVLDTSAIMSVTRITIYSIATDDYVSFKRLICFELRRASNYCT